MASIVGVCNAALQLIKNSKQITSLEQGTKEANACEIIFDEMRDATLEVHNWNFATKRVKLAQLTDTPEFEWDYAYQLPSDFYVWSVFTITLPAVIVSPIRLKTEKSSPMPKTFFSDM